jgi:hypothetical protein
MKQRRHQGDTKRFEELTFRSAGQSPNMTRLAGVLRSDLEELIKRALTGCFSGHLSFFSYVSCCRPLEWDSNLPYKGARDSQEVRTDRESGAFQLPWNYGDRE